MISSAVTASRRLLACVLSSALASLGAMVLEFAVAPVASATEQVNACGANDASLQNNVFTGYSTFGIRYVNQCGIPGEGLILSQDAVNRENPGQTAGWVANAPAGLAIISAYVPQMILRNTLGTGYVAYFYWNGGGGPDSVSDTNQAWFSGIPPSSMFGFMLQCNPLRTTKCPAAGAVMDVEDIQLIVAEAPSSLSITPIGGNNLWYTGASEYVRGGGWSVAYAASAPSGVDSMAASENGQPITYPAAPGCNPNHTMWQQCPGTQTWSPTISLGGSGIQKLVIGAASAAGNVSSPGETIRVDSVQPSVGLSGPTSASSATGTQYVVATANVGPSGLGSIRCSTDGGPAQTYPWSPASIPVSGLGLHSVRCTASNRSYNSAGQVAVSAPAVWSVDIAEPTVSGISFASVINSLKCERVKERVKVAAKWVTVRRHGKRMKVRRRSHMKLVKVVKCHPRIVKRKVTVLVKVRRHGRTVFVKRKKVERIPLSPTLVNESTKTVRFGKGTTVSGFLETAGGIALPDRTVEVLTSPNNQLGQWAPAAVVTTGADGGWTAQLPPGPSRLVAASYAGDTTTLPSTSAAATLLVPARIRIIATPRQLPWSGVVTIRGYLAGGYVPPGGVALRLLIGLPRRHRPYQPVSVRTNAKGAFVIEWSWGSGAGVATYPMRVALIGTGSDYPFTASASRAINVTFGRPTPPLLPLRLVSNMGGSFER